MREFKFIMVPYSNSVPEPPTEYPRRVELPECERHAAYANQKPEKLPLFSDTGREKYRQSYDDLDWLFGFLSVTNQRGSIRMETREWLENGIIQLRS